MTPDPDAWAELVVTAMKTALGPVQARLGALETRVAGLSPAPGRDGRDGLPGRDGVNGAPGPAGADGLGFEDLDLVTEADGVFLTFTKGTTSKRFRLPVVIDCGVYAAERVYGRGDGVTWGGSFWIAQGPTQGEKPGHGATAWRLAVKGR